MMGFFLRFVNSVGEGCFVGYHALQAIPRGPRDGEPVNKRRATVAHVMVNECPNR